MLVQNADRTTYGISKIAIALLAFIIFAVVGYISWQWTGAVLAPYKFRMLVLTPMTMALILYVCCDQFGVYHHAKTRAQSVWRFLWAYLCFVALSVLVFIYLVPFTVDVPAQVSAYILTFIAGLWLRVSRFVAEKTLEETTPTLLVGTPAHTERFQAMLRRHKVHPGATLHVLAPEQVQPQVVRNLLIEKCIHKVVFLPEHVDPQVARYLIDLCGKLGVDFYAGMTADMPAVHKTYFGVLGGARMLVYKSVPIPYTTSWQVKQLMDKAGALALLVLSSPFWLLAATGIKLSDPGPVFYRQRRTGLYGKEFGMWKFRTMFQDADQRLDEIKAKYGNDMDGPIFKLENDPRIFAFGKFLRKFSIDELPQLINVLKGEMSLVGPRPLPIYETAAFTDDAHRRRLSVLPGVTGYWQIAGRSNITDFEKLVELDMHYIDRWSLWLDVKLLLKTIPAVLFARGAK